ncbi:MAG: M6 family metalloprotease domain-containing protein [Candidatus Cloacimonetes bacterium]|nr:M6 family metalloprotease domain-containing protein [Candidatus Cloacimonadota bacterium]
MNNLKSCFILIMLLLAINAYSAWLENIPAIITQPDGFQIDVLRSGDEFHNWIHNEQGFTIVQDHETGFWCWAVNEEHFLSSRKSSEHHINGELVSTGFPIHQYLPSELGINPRENITEERYKEKRDWFMDEINRSTVRSPSVGVVYSIVVFIRFSDDTEFGPEAQIFDEMFHATGENVNSMYQYFWDASYQQLEVFSPFFPLPNGEWIVSYQSQHPRSYFQPYNAVTNPNGYTGGNNGFQRAQREHALLRDAILAIQSQVPITMNLDANNDGYVDNVNFMIRGDSGEWADLLWPHRWVLYSFNVSIHGKMVRDYNFNIENFTYTRGVGVLAHEYAHSLSLPDFYRYYNNDITPISRWCLMAQDNEPPQSINGWAKAKYTAWTTTVNNIPIITANGTYTLYPLSTHKNSIYRINSPQATNQTYIVEYRNTDVAYIDSNLWGKGLVVYRVRPGTGGNADGPPDEIYAYRPNGTTTVNGILEQGFFSLQSGRTAFNNTTNPTPFLENGQWGGLNIYNIGYAGDTITFSVSMTNLPTPVQEPENLSANVVWNNVVLSWEEPVSMSSSSFEYKVYRDGKLITPTPLTEMTYTDLYLPVGHYSYFVTAVSGGHESLPVFVDAEITIIPPAMPPPKNLTSETIENEIVFSWAEPDEEFLPYFMGVNFYLNDSLLNQSPIADYSYSISISSLPIGWNLISVAAVYEYGESEPIHFDIIIKPLLPPSNLNAEVLMHVVYLSWEEPILPDLNSMRIEISNHRSAHTSATAYNVYRNGVLLNETPIIELEYANQYVFEGTYTYSVTTIDGDNESEPISVEVVSDFMPEINPPKNLVSEVEVNIVTLRWEAPDIIDYELVTHIGYNISRDDVFLTFSSIPSFTEQHEGYGGCVMAHFVYSITAIYHSEWHNAIPLESEPISLGVDVGTGSDFDEESVPLVTELFSNFPNPFNPMTTIRFNLAKSDDVFIEIFNLRGQKVKTLINEFKDVGNHSVVWNGTDANGLSVSSGLYFYRMATSDYSSVRAMMLLK